MPSDHLSSRPLGSVQSRWCVENCERNRVQLSRALAYELRLFLGPEVSAPYDLSPGVC